jgi:hypothetical protein
MTVWLNILILSGFVFYTWFFDWIFDSWLLSVRLYLILSFLIFQAFFFILLNISISISLYVLQSLMPWHYSFISLIWWHIFWSRSTNLSKFSWRWPLLLSHSNSSVDARHSSHWWNERRWFCWSSQNWISRYANSSSA